MAEPAKVLTIGGSDSGGAAGIQADLKTFTLHQVYGMSVITVVTAQNSANVQGLEYLTTDFILSQLDAVLSDYGAQAIKTGFIGRAEVVRRLGNYLKEYAGIPLVVDPVLVNHRGEAMFDDDVLHAYSKDLFPLALLVTPSWREAELLTGVRITNLVGATAAARKLLNTGARGVLITGLRIQQDIIDFYYDGHRITLFRSPRLDTQHTHGSGDTLSAAITCHLARGVALLKAIQDAHEFTAGAIERAVAWQMGRGHGPVDLTASWQFPG